LATLGNSVFCPRKREKTQALIVETFKRFRANVNQMAEVSISIEEIQNMIYQAMDGLTKNWICCAIHVQ